MGMLVLPALLAVTFVLSGCSTIVNEWAPFPSNKELTSFADRWAAAPKSGVGYQVADMQRELVKYREEVFARALDRSRLEWESSGFATYGGLLAVAGALADRTGLLNTGVGLAAIGLTNSTRYRFHDQTQIYLTALKRIACITGKLNAADDMTLSLAKGASDPTAATAARNFIDTVIAAVDYVRGEYTNGLLGISPTVPSREELLALINTYRVQAPLGVSGEQNPAQAARDQAGETIKGLATEVQHCSKL